MISTPIISLEATLPDLLTRTVRVMFKGLKKSLAGLLSIIIFARSSLLSNGLHLFSSFLSLEADSEVASTV